MLWRGGPKAKERRTESTRGPVGYTVPKEGLVYLCRAWLSGYTRTGKSQLQQREKTFYEKILANWLKATRQDLASHEFNQNQDKRILKLVRINI